MSEQQEREVDLLIVVRDQTGKPWNDLIVELPDDNDQVQANGTTNENGLCHIADVGRTVRDLIARNNGTLRVDFFDGGQLIATEKVTFYKSKDENRWVGEAVLGAPAPIPAPVPAPPPGPKNTMIRGRLVDTKQQTGLGDQLVGVYQDDQVLSSKTLPDGSFSVNVAPDLEVEVVFPQINGLTMATPGLNPLSVRVRKDETVDLGDVGYVARGGQVSGIVFYDQDQSGLPGNNLPLSGQTVTLRTVANGHTRSFVSDGQGVYLFDNLPTGSYQLQTAANLRVRRIGALQSAANLPSAFYVGPGSDLTLNLPYVLAGGEVAGRVFYDPNGNGEPFGGEPGIKNVSVELFNQRSIQPIIRVYTGDGGDYLFTNVPPGRYQVVFGEMTSAVVGSNPRQTLSLTTAAELDVDVFVGRRAAMTPTGYGPERHTLTGELKIKVGDHDHPAAGYLVYMVDEAQNTYQTTTDRQGRYFHEFADAPGEVKLTFYAPTEDNLIDFENQPVATNTAYVNKPADLGTIYVNMPFDGLGMGGVVQRRDVPDGPGDPAGGGKPNRRHRFWDQPASSPQLDESVEDIAVYMPTAADGGGGGYTTTPFPLQRAVDQVMTEVLGRKLQENDPAAFLAALGRSFTFEGDEENRRVRWTPRLYAIQTELGGAITGAQASLYHRAKTAIDDAMPLLDGLEPLQTAPDEEEVAAVRAIVRTEMTELVNELGLEGGPRVQRVDSILRLLQSEIARMEQVYGLDPQNVITVAEEEALTNYLVIRDYIDSLDQTWCNFRDKFLGTGSGFLGTQLVLLQRALSVVVESVDEAYRAMNSVNLGPNERQTVYIPVPGQDSISVEELLSWVARFARDEAPALVLEGGRRGLEAIEPIAAELAGLVAVAIKAPTGNVGFSRPRVRRALAELQAQLKHVAELCR